MSFDEEELDPHGECAAEIKRLQAEVASKSEQIGKLYKVCNERDVLRNALKQQAVRFALLATACKSEGMTNLAYTLEAYEMDARKAIASASGEQAPAQEGDVK